MITAFNHLFRHTVLVKSPGQNAYGEINPIVSFPSGVQQQTYRARIDYTTQVVRTPENLERLSKATIFLQTTNLIDPRSLLVLPAGWPANPVILNMERITDNAGRTVCIALYI